MHISVHVIRFKEAECLGFHNKKPQGLSVAPALLVHKA